MMQPSRRSKLIFVMTMGLGTSLGASVAHAGYKDGLTLVRQGKWDQATKEFDDMAALGHAPSQFSLALINHLGRGVPRNLKKAYDLYKQSAVQNHPPALNNLGMMYLNGEYVAVNRKIAFKLFSKAGADHAQAKDNLGQCYENGWGVEPDIEQAVNFFKLAGDEGYRLGYYHLGQLHEEGRGGAPVNIPEAMKWYQIAGEATFARGYHRLGEMYEQGIGVPRDVKQAISWYEQAGALGYEPAITKVRKMKLGEGG